MTRLRHDPAVMPHPDGMRTGRWEVRPHTPVELARFRESRLRQIVWVARPILTHEMHRPRVRHLTVRCPSFAAAMRSATAHARLEQHECYQHHQAQETDRAR